METGFLTCCTGCSSSLFKHILYSREGDFWSRKTSFAFVLLNDVFGGYSRSPLIRSYGPRLFTIWAHGIVLSVVTWKSLSFVFYYYKNGLFFCSTYLNIVFDESRLSNPSCSSLATTLSRLVVTIIIEGFAW